MDEQLEQTEQSGESKKTRSFPWKIAIPALAVVMVAAAVCIILMLKGRGADEEETATLPIAYSVGQIEIPAMSGEDGEEIAWTEESEGIFTYTGFSDPTAAAEDYVTALLGSELGFALVDDSYTKLDEADFTEESGTVGVACASEVSGQLYSVVVAWSAEGCVVTMDISEGTIREASKESSSSLAERMAYFKSLAPAVLGLEGQSMEEYEVYSMSGVVLVNGSACLQIKVCTKNNPEGTNEPCGLYLLSSDGAHLYHLDQQTDTVTELKI